MRVQGVPVFVLFLGLLAVLMLVPSLHGALEGDWRSARLFLFASVFTSFCASVLGAVTQGDGPAKTPVREELLTVVGVFALAPLFAATPIWLSASWLGWEGAYFEAVSSITTTGATLITDPRLVSNSLHLWRALLGWTGGFATLVAVAAVFVPRELLDMPGGAVAVGTTGASGRAMTLGAGGVRTLRAAGLILPVYAGLTFVAAAVLASSGATPFAAVSHAMGIVATSGISAEPGGFGAGGAGRLGEVAAVSIGLLAATRFLWRGAMRRGRRGADPLRRRLRSDPEVQLLLIAVILAALGVFASGLDQRGLSGLLEEPALAARALWGGVSTAVGFLTTTGYASADWPSALEWSGAEALTPLLLGLATLGGGVASTAGGIKLFRAYLLWRHGLSEIGRLVHPHVVDTTQTQSGEVVQHMIRNAWVLVMLAMAALGLTLAAMTLSGLDFSGALTAAVASLGNVGPLLPFAAGYDWTEISPEARSVAMAAMVLGRIELLAAVALFNPDYWRR